MRARQDADFGRDRPDRTGVAPVDAAAAAQDRAAHDVLFELLEDFERQRALLVVDEELAGQRLGGVEPVAAILLALLAIGRIDQRPDRLAHPALDRVVLGGDRRQVPGLARAGLGEIDDRLDHRLKLAMAEADRAQHHVLGKLARLRFDHQHALCGAGDDEVELRARQLGQGRVQHIGAVDIGDARPADRP